MTIFDDLDDYISYPRLTSLAASRNGSRIVVTVQTANAKKTAYRTALWEIDPAGEAPARRLTRSRKGESSATFTDAGDLLFTSARPDPDADEDEEGPSALWLAPADGGEARVICNRPGGVGRVLSRGEVVVLAADVLPGATDEASDADLRKQRKDAKISAILHATYPIREWDSDLGPGAAHLMVADLPADSDAGSAPAKLDLRDLTPDARRGEFGDFDLSADGSTIVATCYRPLGKGDQQEYLQVIDVASGERRDLVREDGVEAWNPVISPDGRRVAFQRARVATPTLPFYAELWVVDVEGGNARRVAPEWDREAAQMRWDGDGRLIVTADSDGRGPVFAIDVASGEVTQLTTDDAAFAQITVADGVAYALRSSYAAPAEPVVVALEGTAPSRTLRSPVPTPELPGRLDEVEVTADDGARVRGWLALPPGASTKNPAPLLLWIHGGPLNSWNAWTWRWCPWLMVAKGYAVLLPDPALSTGYGRDFIARGWNSWGAKPFTDLMAITDAAEAREDIDATRTAAMGGSFGGYMANWVAGHTNRFRAIVSHASLWDLTGFGATTDAAFYWAREMDEAMSAAHSPHASAAQIRTPMLVVHGDKDYRVPIGEGLKLWWDLMSKSQLPLDEDGATPHRFLYFPDENHWVLTPQHAKVWYQVVTAFLARHVLGQETELPGHLR